MSIVQFDPFEEMRALQKQIFGVDPWTPSSKNSIQLPATDIYTNKNNQLVVEAHLPHFDQKDVDVSVDRGVLEISAEKHEKEEDKSKKYVVRESSSSFYRRVRLPERADSSKIKAHMEHGVLKVTMPVKELPKLKKINISTTKSKKTSK